MILEYTITDNKLEKENPIDYPVHLQNNIILRFNDKNGLINDKSYAFIKTHDNVKKVKIIKNGELCACELPPFTTHNTFFKLKVLVLQDKHQMITNELIIPIRVSDYLDYNRTLAHAFKHPKRNGCYKDGFDDKFSKRYHPHHIFRQLTEEDLESIDSEYLKFLIQYKFSVNELAIIFNTDVQSVKDKLEEVGVYY